jgi:tetratricopeptide (TPR) repeat protein
MNNYCSLAIFAAIISLCAMPSVSAADKQCKLAKVGELPVTMSGRQPMIVGTINGQPARFMVNSGAFYSVLRKQAAENFRLPVRSQSGNIEIYGIGGAERAGLVTVRQFTLAGLWAGHVYENVDFLVSKSLVIDADGVVGQNILSIADAEYDLANGKVRLIKSVDCKNASLAYWRGNQGVAEMDLKKRSPEEPHWMSEATLNGKKIRVLFDSSASRSYLVREAASKLGITPDSDGARAAGMVSGIGPLSVEASIARFDVLDLGGETIKNAKITFGESRGASNFDLLLGADFMLSHRIYFAVKQNKLYFTYNGGPVFDTRPRYSDAATDTQKAEVDVPKDSNLTAHSTLDSAELRQRGTAFMGRGDYLHAIEDFDQAIKLDPDNVDNYYQRGVAYLNDRRGTLALPDLSEVLRRNPQYVPALLVRGAMYVEEKEEAKARADFDMAVRADPSDGRTELVIAGIYQSSKHYALAIEKYDHWLDTFLKDPRVSSVLNSRCWSRALLGKELERALADCNASIKKGSANSMNLDSRGMVYLRLGKYDQAIADYSATLKLQPKQAATMYGLGLAKAKKGLSKEGEQYMQSALGLSQDAGDFFKEVGLVP